MHLKGFGVKYFGKTGAILHHKRPIAVAPRLGSNDTVGIGFA